MTLNPFDFVGTTFLGFYALVIACSIVGVLVLRRVAAGSGDDGRRGEPRLDPFETAVLAGGAGRLTLLVIATLADRRLVRFDGQNLLYTGRLPGETLHPVAHALFDQAPPTIGQARAQLVPAARSIEQTLAGEGLIAGRDAAGVCKAITWMAFLLVLSLGVAKTLVGLDRGRPVGFLVAMVVAAIVAFFLLLKLRPPMTARGRRLLDALRHERPRAVAGRAAPVLADVGTATLVALWGLPMLESHPAYTDLRRSFANGGDGSTTFSSDSSGGGGGGDGGGCGGGGCGGCGGD